MAKSRTIGLLALSWDSDRKGIGAETCGDAAEWGDGWIADNVDEVDRDEARSRALLGPVANAANMVAIAQADQRHTVSCRLGDADFHRVMRHDLTEAAVRRR